MAVGTFLTNKKKICCGFPKTQPYYFSGRVKKSKAAYSNLTLLFNQVTKNKYFLILLVIKIDIAGVAGGWKNSNYSKGC